MTGSPGSRYNDLLKTTKALASKVDSVESLERAAIILQRLYPYMRYGQALSNLFYRAASNGVGFGMQAALDPYYDDNNIEKFLEFARKHL